jgi:environmental stress-induced protein Ves
MKARVILPADYRVTTWRSGTGKTAEIAMAPGAGNRFTWRLSIADVPESGPFSDYAGYERIIAVVDGAGMRLTVGERTPALLTRESEPFAFPGHLPTTCALLAGPIRDFNLIFDPTLVRATVNIARLDGGPARSTLRGGISLIYAAGQDLWIEHPQFGRSQLLASATLRIDEASGPVSIDGPADGTALIATIDQPS